MSAFSVPTTKHTQFINIDAHVQAQIDQAGAQDGLVHVFVPHTTAAVTINENADPDVVADIEKVVHPSFAYI